MSDIGQQISSASNTSLDDEARRAGAVAAAMEAIAAKGLGGGDLNLAYELENLSKYADQIQDALSAKK